MKHPILKYSAVVALICIIQSFNCYGQGPVIDYNANNTYTKGKKIDPLKPKITGNAISFKSCPELPDGFKLDPKTGEITGTPAAASDGKYCIMAADANAIGKPFQITITVKDTDKTKKPDNGTSSQSDCCKVNTQRQLESGEWVLVFLPITLFIVFLIVFLRYIGKATSESGTDNRSTRSSSFNIRDALSESSYSQVIEKNPEYNNTNVTALITLQGLNTNITALPVTTLFPTTITTTDNKYRSSVSRLIAFLTSMLSLVIGLCLCSFFIYAYFRNGCTPDISKLSAVLISMGIGVVPYAFNKVSTMSGNNGATNPQAPK